MAGYIGTQAVSVNTTSATISDDLSVGDDLTVTDDATIGGTALVTGVLTTTAAAVFSGGFTSNGDTVTFTSANATDPLLIIQNTTNDAASARIRFVKDKGAAGADDDKIGTIEFFSDNAAQEQTQFALIRAEVAISNDGAEGGKLRLQVATHDGEMQSGLILADGNAEDEIDVQIAKGTSSLTTIAGNTTITSDLSVTGVTLVRNGTLSAPAIGNTGDSNTGMFFPADETIGFTSGGVASFNLTNGGNIVYIGSMQIQSDGQSGLLALAGGNNSNDGSNIGLHGPSHSSLANVTRFRQDTAESMRIDANGNLLVNCAAARSQNTAVSGGVLLQVKGDIVPDIDAGNTGHSDLGDPSFRFEDTFCRDAATTGSDQNDKQNIAVLSSTEMAVAARISQNFKLFKWKDSVAAKGNDARTHAGTMAQDIKAAFIAEDLDASNYAMFMSNSWWEHDVEVDAVESNEDEGIIAADAYTRTDLYHVESEAPEGSTAVTRLGVRYSEVMSFLAAYNEQRFAAIETRLTALEG